MKIKTLLIGSIPPPIGGISMHVIRFFESYNISEAELTVFDIRKLKIFKKDRKLGLVSFFPEFFTSHIIHTHLSNNLLNCAIALLSKLFFKKVVYTHHNTFFETSFFLKWLFLLCDSIIGVNKLSLNSPLFNKYKSKVVIIPAFIKPNKFDEIDQNLLDYIKNYKFIIIANCFRSMMWNTKNIYGFDILVRAFNYAIVNNYIDASTLVLVDPSNTSIEITNLLSSMHENVKSAVKFIGKPIDFSSLIKHASVVVRPTRTDGDALTIREAIYLNKPVIASNVVERPEGVITYDTEDYIDLANKLREVFLNKKEINTFAQPDYGMEIINLYKKLLSKTIII